VITEARRHDRRSAARASHVEPPPRARPSTVERVGNRKQRAFVAAPGHDRAERAEGAERAARAGRRVHDQSIPRRGLLARLRRADGARVVILTGPAGSGKTTLLRQWAAADPRPACWVPVLQDGFDPAGLVGRIAEAIATALPEGPVARLAAAAGPVGDADVASLNRAIALESRPLLLLLDDLHLLDDPGTDRLVARLADGLPKSWSLGFASRSVVSLPTARWRLRGTVVELGLADLAFDEAECREVLIRVGVDPSPELVADVRARTEGWAAGVHLAALALRAGRAGPQGAAVAGDVDGIRSYLETELLAGLDAETHGLLVRTSVVDAVCGPLADAITGGTGSAARLYELSRRNQMVIPLDPQRRWFRYHRLLRDLLARELEDSGRDPAEAAGRAAAWYAAAGRLDDAIEVAFAGGDERLAGRLVLASLPAAYRKDRGAAISAWIQALSADTLIAEPALPIAAALVAGLEGDPLAATHWVAVSDRSRLEPPSERKLQPRPSRSRDADAALLDAVLCRDGPDTMLADADRALAAHDLDWPWRPLALLAAGAARAMLGDAAGAADRYLRAEQSPETAGDVFRLAVRAERALDAVGRKRWPEVQALLGPDRAAVLADPNATGISGLLWLVADARLAIHRGDLRTAEERLCRAEAGRRRLSWAIPWFAARTLAELARARLLLGDAAAAVADLVAAREVVAARPSLGHLATTVAELLGLASSAVTPRLPGTSSLTPAELRLLPFLQTYLTLREIGERLGVSGNTVKTEAVSIYAKLGAGSRSEAVTSAVTHGLLEDIFA
jgi:LuxR family maltose regulon positive regulatory protein